MYINFWCTRNKRYNYIVVDHFQNKLVSPCECSKFNIGYVGLISTKCISRKGKIIPITGHQDPRGCECKGPHIRHHGTRLTLRSIVFTPGKLRYRRLRVHQDRSDHEEEKTNLHPSDTRDRTRAVQPVAKRLAAWATWPTFPIICFKIVVKEPQFRYWGSPSVYVSQPVGSLTCNVYFSLSGHSPSL